MTKTAVTTATTATKSKPRTIATELEKLHLFWWLYVQGGHVIKTRKCKKGGVFVYYTDKRNRKHKMYVIEADIAQRHIQEYINIINEANDNSGDLPATGEII